MTYRLLFAEQTEDYQDYLESKIWMQQRIVRSQIIAGRPTIRFWQYINHGWVRIALRPGETFLREIGGPTDEGWFSKSDSYHWDGETLTHEWESCGQDCDGRLDREGVDIAFDLRLNTETTYPALWVPDWIEKTSQQRDYSAEAMGY